MGNEPLPPANRSLISPPEPVAAPLKGSTVVGKLIFGMGKSNCQGQKSAASALLPEVFVPLLFIVKTLLVLSKLVFKSPPREEITNS
mgnify:CR=1 FL=1